LPHGSYVVSSRRLSQVRLRFPTAFSDSTPGFSMSDLPVTSGHVAYECLEAALEAGLRNVKIGNIHLLGYR
jgi:hypothetical protein